MMRAPGRMIFNVCGRSGVPALLLRGSRRLKRRWLTVLAYHRICERHPNTPWDPEVVSATPEMFRRQMEFVRKHFSIVTSREISLWKEGRFDMPPNPLAITFDDGYRDAHDVALPLLREAGLSGEFFVCPWHLSKRRLFWWDRLAFLISRAKHKRFTIDYPAHLNLDAIRPEEVDRTRKTLLRLIKLTRGLDLEQFLTHVQERTGAEIDEEHEAERLLMSWEHVRTLHAHGMCIGSHSYSHPILSLSDTEVALGEMTRSKAEIEARLKEKVCSIAYPVGSFTAETKRLAEEAGYAVGYSYCTGATFLHAPDFYEIRRVDVDRHVSLEYFRMLAALPFLHKTKAVASSK